MRHLLHTTAIAAAFAAFTFGAQAQESNDAESAVQSASAPSYCDTRWSSVDGNEDGFVSRDEATGAMDDQFSAIDADGNGEITKTEYVDCMTRTGDQASAEADRTEDAFASVDTDGDDQISREEFRDAAKQAFEQSRSAAADDEAVVVFRRFVWLTPEESGQEGIHSDMSADEAAARSAKTFAALDKNSDDIIDTQEWSERSPKAGIDEEWANARFEELDEDKSGAIGKEEYRTARNQMLDEMTTASTDGDASGGASDDSASTGDQGIPVYVYRFWTF